MPLVASPNLENCDHSWICNKENYHRDLPALLCAQVHTQDVHSSGSSHHFSGWIPLERCWWSSALAAYYTVGLKSCFRQSMRKELSKDPPADVLHQELGCLLSLLSSPSHHTLCWTQMVSGSLIHGRVHVSWTGSHSRRKRLRLWSTASPVTQPRHRHADTGWSLVQVLWGQVLSVSLKVWRFHVVGMLHIERSAINRSGLKSESRFRAAEWHSTSKILAKAFRCRKTSSGCKGYITPCDWENW